VAGEAEPGRQRRPWRPTARSAGDRGGNRRSSSRRRSDRGRSRGTKTRKRDAALFGPERRAATNPGRLAPAGARRLPAGRQQPIRRKAVRQNKRPPTYEQHGGPYRLPETPRDVPVYGEAGRSRTTRRNHGAYHPGLARSVHPEYTATTTANPRRIPPQDPRRLPPQTPDDYHPQMHGELPPANARRVPPANARELPPANARGRSTGQPAVPPANARAVPSDRQGKYHPQSHGEFHIEIHGDFDPSMPWAVQTDIHGMSTRTCRRTNGQARSLRSSAATASRRTIHGSYDISIHGESAVPATSQAPILWDGRPSAAGRPFRFRDVGHMRKPNNKGGLRRRRIRVSLSEQNGSSPEEPERIQSAVVALP